MKAIYVSVWDDGVQIEVECEFNPDTNSICKIAEDERFKTVNDFVDEWVILPPDNTVIRQFTREMEELAKS